MRNLWVTGYRSYELNVFSAQDKKVQVIQYALKNQLKAFLDEGLAWIITGGQMGIEQWTLALADDLKHAYPELRSAAMLPFADFGSNWNENNQQMLQTAIATADFSEPISKQPYENPQQLRTYQAFMLEHTDGALLVYDPEFPGKTKYDYAAITKYQEQTDYGLTLIDMYALEEAAQQLNEIQ
ncbi:MAG: DUF1273 domain-containing protein [Lactobacillus sp.]|jgi:uncharacterized phage-like protein YoqJ|nr:DUF1273 domain-containing protein [Lactobacillus sp.]